MGKGERDVFLCHPASMKDGKVLPATGFDAVPILRLGPMRVELDGQTSPRARRTVRK